VQEEGKAEGKREGEERGEGKRVEGTAVCIFISLSTTTSFLQTATDVAALTPAADRSTFSLQVYSVKIK